MKINMKGSKYIYYQLQKVPPLAHNKEDKISVDTQQILKVCIYPGMEMLPFLFLFCIGGSTSSYLR